MFKVYAITVQGIKYTPSRADFDSVGSARDYIMDRWDMDQIHAIVVTHPNGKRSEYIFNPKK